MDGKHICIFKQEIQKGSSYFIRNTCKECASSSQISRQCCDLQLCVRCWKGHCELYNWDPELSKCANIICDSLSIDPRQRQNINQFNISQILALSNCHKFRHVSNKRRYKIIKQNKNINDPMILY